MKIKNQKKMILRNFWYLLSISFFINSIFILNSEKYGVNYQLNENIEKKLHFAECFSPLNFLSNRSRISIVQLNYDIYAGLKKRLSKLSEDDISEIKILNKIIDMIKLKKYFIFRNRVCLIFDDQSQLGSFSDGKFYAYNKESFEFFELQDAKYRVENYIILNLPFPYFNCSKEGNKFLCLNNCIKKKQNFSKYYYEAKEKVFVDLVYQYGQTNAAEEKKCLKECKKTSESCVVNYFYPKNSMLESSTSMVFESYALMSEFGYWLELIILILLFLNISIFQLLLKSIKAINLKLYLTKRKQAILKWSVFFANLILISVFCFHTLKDYHDKRDNPQKKEMLINSKSIKPEPINLIMCIDINKILGWRLKVYEEDYFNNTYAQMEKITDESFNKSRISVYLEFQSSKMDIDWEIMSKVIFW